MNKACDQQMQTLTAEAEQDILALRHKATTDAATTNASGHPSAEVAACEQVLADLQATVPLPPHRLVAADTGIEMMGVVTEARRVAQTLLQDGRPPLATTPNALLLAHGPAYRGPSLSVGAELTMLELQECVETDILLLEPDRCYALVGSETDLPSGSVHEFGWDQDAHKWRRKAQRGPMSAVPPSEHEMAAHEGILRQLYDALPEIDAVLEYVHVAVSAALVPPKTHSPSFLFPTPKIIPGPSSWTRCQKAPWIGTWSRTYPTAPPREQATPCSWWWARTSTWS